MRLALIVAMAKNRVIGDQNRLPWYLPEDLKYFKQTTLGKPVIMGRKTYDSIGKPLPGRTNIVITRNSEWRAEGVKVVSSFDEAVELAEAQALIDGCEEAVVMGGAQIYEQALARVDRLYLTEVDAEPTGDAFFPPVDLTQWQEQARKPHPAGDTPGRYAYSFVVYDRIES